ncbi:Hypothetical protein HVR_LOCUS821 [uncultured virus]|nr:Hypothetical protein HVR_LOCUS821 [uncultured virus]
MSKSKNTISMCFGGESMSSMFGGDGNVQIGKFTTGDRHKFPSKEQALRVLPTFAGFSKEPPFVKIAGEEFRYINGQLIPTDNCDLGHEAIPLRKCTGLFGSVKNFKYGTPSGEIRMVWTFPAGVTVIIYKNGIQIPGDGKNLKLETIPDFDINCFKLPDAALLAYLQTLDRTYSCAIGGTLMLNIQHIIQPKIVDFTDLLDALKEKEKEEKPDLKIFISEECVICMDRAPEKVFLPCCHKCVCDTCNKQLCKAVHLRCPVCRVNVTEIH